MVLALLAILAPVSASLPVAANMQERWQTKEELDQVLNQAAMSYTSGRGLPFLLDRYEEEARVTEKKLMKLAREKRAVRLERASVKTELVSLQEKYGAIHTSTGSLAVSIGSGSFLSRFVSVTSMRTLLRTRTESVVRRLLFSSLGEMTDDDVRFAVASTVLDVVARMHELQDMQIALATKHTSLLREYVAMQDLHDVAERGKLQTAERMRAVQRTVEEVHAQVIALQSELARIDARLRAKAERELIQKGLRSAGRTHAAASDARPQFALPAHGRTSAGFMNPSYEQFFGVPHRGLDIVVPQGSPVFSAADGIVFIARDGGETGFSYVLIGHRNGYATLYGHLSEILVEPGQDVSIGDMIGKSGGEPGTHGAGPMTTGSHLHFEVIRNGEHVDPVTVLP